MRRSAQQGSGSARPSSKRRRTELVLFSLKPTRRTTCRHRQGLAPRVPPNPRRPETPRRHDAKHRAVFSNLPPDKPRRLGPRAGVTNAEPRNNQPGRPKFKPNGCGQRSRRKRPNCGHGRRWDRRRQPPWLQQFDVGCTRHAVAGVEDSLGLPNDHLVIKRVVVG